MNLAATRSAIRPRARRGLLATTLALLVLSPGTAHAAAAVDLASTTAGSYSVHGTCSAVIGYVSGFNQVEYVVEAEGSAYDERWTEASSLTLEADRTPTSEPTPDGVPVPPPDVISVPTPDVIIENMEERVAGVVAVATSVSCEVYDTATGAVYGSVAGGLPGPAVAAVDTVTVPLHANVAARVCVTAIFADGTWVSTC